MSFDLTTCCEAAQRTTEACYALGERMGALERLIAGFSPSTERAAVTGGQGSDDAAAEVDTNDPQETLLAEISLAAVTGLSGPQTLRFQAQVEGVDAVVLVDSGSTHNFVTEKKAEEMRLPLEPITPFVVKVANGKPLICRSKCDDVTLLVQGSTITVSLFILPIRGLDMVLGVQWLEDLGPVTCDWKTLCMKFKWRDKDYCLQGIAAGLKQVSFDAISAEDGTAWALLFPLQDDDLAPLVPGMRELIAEYGSVFATPNELPPRREVDHRIPLREGAAAVNVRPYRYAHHQKAEIERQVQEMLASGLIRPSSSPFSSPVLLVKKKDGTWRFCTDYRALNSATIRDRYPIPTVDDMLDELYGAKYFTRLDLRAGYHQIQMDEADVHKTAFRTHNGHYEYLVMPFGLCNAPSTFQAAMNDLFRLVLRKHVLVFFDDILIYSRTWDDHLEHVKTTLALLRQHHYYVKFSKCAFGLQELEYLGHLISDRGVRVDPKKVQAMTEWPIPKNVTALRGFLGLTGYYRKFVKNYGEIARPLTDLLRKGGFRWTPAADHAFSALKEALVSTPTLAMPNFDLPFVIEADASGKGVGAVLSQQGHPIAYMSKTLGPAKEAWSTYRKEMYAITQAVQQWRPYLLGQKFHIYTDQRSLKYLLDQRVATPDQHKWVSKLLGFDYELHYRTGASNRAADALSRMGEGEQLHAMTSPIATVWDEVRAAIHSNPYLQAVKAKALSETPGHYAFRAGLVYYRDRVVLPPLSSLVTTILQEFHDSPMGGHSGAQRTLARVARHFYWPQMGKAVRDYIASCDVCQRVKTETLSPAGLLQPLPIPCQVWEDISMDFVEGLPISGGRSVLFVVVDRLTKYAHFMTLSHPYSARSVVEEFINEVVRHHGLPTSIVCDRDAIFVSKFWKEFFSRTGTRINMSSAYHPQSDGQTEVVNRCVEQYLRCFSHSQPHRWGMFLPWAELWYNTPYHKSIGMTPFKALYGRDPPSVIPYARGSSGVGAVDQLLGERDAILRQLKTTLAAANEYNKQLADKRRRAVEFAVDDWVLLRLQPYRQHSLFRRASQKLAARYFGAYQVVERVGAVAYRIGLPVGARLHPVFHVSLLKAYRGNPPADPPGAPPVSEEGELEITPAAILDHRWRRQGGKVVEECLVHWHNLHADDATWELTTDLLERFPSFDLEDKVRFSEGSNGSSSKDVDQPPMQPMQAVQPRTSRRVIKPNPRYLS
ncbi:unnamed protein product [Linum trigynum]|uniref:Reverse transcriptase n=1 Tax=Linum trigynum TaxID=586398 RepID=A0AAV2F7Y3_9ROSI